MSNVSLKEKSPVFIDARGPRYSAAITTTVLALALITESNYLIGFQFAVFLSAVLFGLRRSIYGIIYRNLIQPRLSGPIPSENEAAPRFAQLIGALFAFVALLGGVTGSTAIFLTSTSFALVAAFLNATFGFCLGCQMYLLLLRFKSNLSRS
jgi:hypothetical protein